MEIDPRSLRGNATCHVVSMDASWLVRSQPVREHEHSSITQASRLSVIHHLPSQGNLRWCNCWGEWRSLSASALPVLCCSSSPVICCCDQPYQLELKVHRSSGQLVSCLLVGWVGWLAINQHPHLFSCFLVEGLRLSSP